MIHAYAEIFGGRYPRITYKEVDFDATPWFEQATITEIANLDIYGFQNSIASDAVFKWMALNTGNPDLTAALEKVEKNNFEFEVVINEKDANRWHQEQQSKRAANRAVDALLGEAKPRQTYSPDKNYIAVDVDGSVHWVWQKHPSASYDRFNRPHFPFGSWLLAWREGCAFSAAEALAHLQRYKSFYNQAAAPHPINAYALVNEAVIGDGNSFDDITQKNEFTWRTWASIPEAPLGESDIAPSEDPEVGQFVHSFLQTQIPLYLRGFHPLTRNHTADAAIYPSGKFVLLNEHRSEPFSYESFWLVDQRKIKKSFKAEELNRLRKHLLGKAISMWVHGIVPETKKQYVFEYSGRVFANKKDLHQ